MSVKSIWSTVKFWSLLILQCLDGLSIVNSSLLIHLVLSSFHYVTVLLPLWCVWFDLKHLLQCWLGGHKVLHFMHFLKGLCFSTDFSDAISSVQLHILSAVFFSCYFFLFYLFFLIPQSHPWSVPIPSLLPPHHSLHPLPLTPQKL